LSDGVRESNQEKMSGAQFSAFSSSRYFAWKLR